MKTPLKIFMIGCLLLVTTGAFAFTLPTLHAIGQHRCAMLLTPSSEQPVVVTVTDAQQQIFLQLSLDATDGVEQRINFAPMPPGHYFVEVRYNGRSFHKVVHLQNDHVNTVGASTEFQATENFVF